MAFENVVPDEVATLVHDHANTLVGSVDLGVCTGEVSDTVGRYDKPRLGGVMCLQKTFWVVVWGDVCNA